jgi:hypothetical protein
MGLAPCVKIKKIGGHGFRLGLLACLPIDRADVWNGRRLSRVLAVASWGLGTDLTLIQVREEGGPGLHSNRGRPPSRGQG